MLNKSRNDFFLILTAYLAYGAVFILGLTDPAITKIRLPVILLLLLFGVGLALPDDPLRVFWKRMLRTGIQVAIVCTLMAISQAFWGFAILFFVLGPEVVFRFPTRIGFTWIGIFILATGIIYSLKFGPSGLLTALPFAAGNLFFAVFGWVLVQSEWHRKKGEELLAELRQTHEQLQRYAAQVEELAVAQERNRLARDVHDTLGHQLTIAAVQLEGAQRLIPTNPERASQMVGTVREQVRAALYELRRMVATLRAPLNEDMPIIQALKKLVGDFESATGIRIHLLLEETFPQLPDAKRQAIYRAAQEALTNVHRHAHARDVWLQLIHAPQSITLLVGDNGIGIAEDQANTGFGLRGMRERAVQLGGELFLDSRVGGGTQLTFCLPLSEEKTDAENYPNHVGG